MGSPSPLSALLHPIGIAEFLDNIYQKEARHIKGPSDKFAETFSWDDLNRLLNQSTGVPPTLKLSSDGKQFRPLDAVHLIEKARAGATLILENVDRLDLSLAIQLNGLSEELGELTRCNAYLSYPEYQGYNLHYDVQDFFILQIEGYKEWMVLPPTTNDPLFDQKHHDMEPPSEDSAYLQCVLSPGDVLYMPRGHWHAAVAKRNPSLHLTLSFFTTTGIDFVKWFAEELTEHTLFRKSFPLRLEAGNSRVVAAREHFERLREELRQALESEELLERFIESRIGSARDRIPFSFPQHYITSREELHDAQLFYRRPFESHLSVIGSSLRLVCSARVLEFEGTVEPIVRFVLAHSEFTREELQSSLPDLSSALIMETLLPFVREGLLVVRTHRK